MDNNINEFLKQKSFAVAGSFKDESRYAYRVLKTLVDRGHDVYPVSLSLDEVEGRKIYRSVKDLPIAVDVISIVTPPAASEQIVKQCIEKGIKRVWFQPGAESEEAVRMCIDNGIDVIHGLCVMREHL